MTDNISKHQRDIDGTSVKTCGVVRPIAAMGDYDAKHWADVGRILEESAELSGYRARLVSESSSSNIILQEIVTNLYQDEVVVCDVSGRNPNVMFELGLRMAFQKPVVVVCDDETPFSFDIGVVKHIIYPRTLRYGDIISFREQVAAALPQAIEAGNNYLQRFGPIVSTSLGERNVGIKDVLSELTDLRSLVLERRVDPTLNIPWSTGNVRNKIVYPKADRFMDAAKIRITTNLQAALRMEEFFRENSIQYGTHVSSKGVVEFSVLDLPPEFTSEGIGAVIRSYDPDATFEVRIS